MSKKNRGIIALFPAIIISSILIVLCVSASQSFLAFLYRATIFDQKIQSTIIAHSCVLRVLAKHIQNNDCIGGESIFIENNLCVVGMIATTTGSVSVKIGDAISMENFSY
jgi:hypothetical protein